MIRYTKTVTGSYRRWGLTLGAVWGCFGFGPFGGIYWNRW